MVNAWSLAWEELNGTMNETYPVNTGVGNTAAVNEEIHTVSLDTDLDAIAKSGGFEWTPGSPWPPTVPIPDPITGDIKIDPDGGVCTVNGYEHSDDYYDYTRNDPYAVNPFTDPKDRERAFKVTGQTPYIYESPDGGKTVYRYESGTDPLKREEINTKVDQAKPMQELSINKSDYKKYEEDKGIKDLQEYVTSTYNGHYTTKGSNVQTLDLIESVGDAPSFCRSNAIKYLSRYEKKGQAKRDILKAMHYCLLLYYFSGQTHDNEIQRGYETF